jgi:hypothetical protein
MAHVFSCERIFLQAQKNPAAFHKLWGHIAKTSSKSIFIVR